MEIINAKEHFHSLNRWSELLWRQMEMFVEHSSCEMLLDQDGVFVKRKFRSSLRLHLSALCYFLQASELPSCQEDLPLKELCLPEMLNIATYESNACLDMKGIVTKLEITPALLRSLMWHEMVHTLIANSGQLDDSASRMLARLYAESSTKVYDGQRIDLFELRFQNATAFDEATFYEKYIERCQKIGASTILTCTGSATLAHCPEPILIILDSILKAFGTAGQMINDIADCFVRNRHVKHRDNFADLRNGRLTLPYYILHQNGLDLLKLQAEISQPNSSRFLVNLFAQHRIADIVKEHIEQDLLPTIEQGFEALAAECPPAAVSRLRFILPFLRKSKILDPLQ